MSPRVLVLLPVVAVLAGCGESGEPVRDRDGTLRIALDEYRFAPERISVASRDLHLIVLRNRGRLTHNLEVQSYRRRNGERAFVHRRTATVHPGKETREDLSLRPGKYKLVCTIGNHDDLGQFGELVVTGS